jgi:hypothetical protein
LNISTSSEGLNTLKVVVLDGFYFQSTEGEQIPQSYSMKKKIPKYPKTVKRGSNSMGSALATMLEIGILANFAMNFLLYPVLIIFLETNQ